MTKNKIVLKHMKPVFALAIAAFIGTVATTTVAVVKDQKNQQNGTKKIIAFSAAFFTALASVIFMAAKETRSHANKIYSRTARLFITKTAVKHPELAQFCDVLRNERALQNVTAMICNSLRPEEQKRIYKIISDVYADGYDSKTDEIAAFEKANNQIVKILENHAAVHPEFVNEVYANMAYSDMIYVMPTQQYAR